MQTDVLTMYGGALSAGGLSSTDSGDGDPGRLTTRKPGFFSG